MIKITDNLKIDGLEEIKKDSILELSKDSNVIEYLKKNNLPISTISNNWSTFLEYSEDKKICSKCYGLQDCPKYNKGIIKKLVISDNKINTIYTSCNYYSQSNAILSHFVVYNVNKNIILTSLESLVEKEISVNNQEAYIEIMKYIKKPSEQGIFIHGENPNNDKTYLMAALMNSLASKGKDVGFIHFPSYIAKVKASFNSEESIDWTSLLNVPYLVLDSIGEENVTSYSRDEILLTILSYRSLNNLPTFFTSYYGYKDLIKIYTTKKSEELKVKTLLLKIKSLCKEIVIE